jgi:hypothetical protein
LLGASVGTSDGVYVGISDGTAEGWKLGTIVVLGTGVLGLRVR